MTLDELIQELTELRERLGTGHYETGVKEVATHAGNHDTLPRVILHK